MSGPAPAAFAIPGDLHTRTGGFIYERRVLEELREAGRDVAHIRLGAGFPDPSAAEMTSAIAACAAVPPGRPLIVDGLVFGAIDTGGLAQTRAPVVAMIHHPLALETGLSADRADHLYRTERDNLALAAHVVVPSPHTSEVLRTRYGVPAAKITLALPGVARPTAQALAQADPPEILAIGLLHPRKGHDVLLEALARIAGRRWQAVIVGRAHAPGEAEVLRALRDRLGLAARVRFAGELGEAALETLWARASLFALATRYEGYGMVFAEAAVRGLPIVATAAGAVPQTVPAAAGILVPPDQPKAFAEALAALLDDPELRAAKAAGAARHGAGLPDWPDTAARMGAVLDRLAAAAS